MSVNSSGEDTIHVYPSTSKSSHAAIFPKPIIPPPPPDYSPPSTSHRSTSTAESCYYQYQSPLENSYDCSIDKYSATKKKHDSQCYDHIKEDVDADDYFIPPTPPSPNQWSVTRSYRSQFSDDICITGDAYTELNTARTDQSTRSLSEHGPKQKQPLIHRPPPPPPPAWPPVPSKSCTAEKQSNHSLLLLNSSEDHYVDHLSLPEMSITIKDKDAPRQWRLYAVEDRSLRESILLNGHSSYIIGTDATQADIVLHFHAGVSPLHASIGFRPVELPDGSVSMFPYIKDFHSNHKTYVNGIKLKPFIVYDLYSNDSIRFGLTRRDYILVAV